MKLLNRHFLLIALLLPVCAWGQEGTIRGVVRDAQTGQLLSGANVVLAALNRNTLTDDKGTFQLGQLPYGEYELVVFTVGKTTWKKTLSLDRPELKLKISMEDLSIDLDAVEVQAGREESFGITRLRSVEGTAIYEGKKSEVVVLDDIVANQATNNPRQVFARITGLNIWESDGAGLQLGIGGRGLSPNRTSNFNTRQNGYDISADALGYPESYYTPPVEALERIEVVRGAASLQYGTQFGGMVNFVFKRPPRDKPIQLVTRQTIGSFGFFGSFNSLAGTVADGKFSYYAFYNRRQGNGWRPNGEFTLNNGFVSVGIQPNEKLRIGLEATIMGYLAQQPGGLTDAFFEQDPRQSIRERNWFQVNWNLFALTLDYRFSDRTQLNVRNFGLLARRQSLGALTPINNIDFGGNRTLIDGQFNNFGSEARLLHRYSLLGTEQTALIGMRVYRGMSDALQGDGTDGSGPDFRFLNPDDVEGSDYVFPSFNLALFGEQIFVLGPKWTLTPGIRFEFIQTLAEGYFKQRVFDAAGNLVAENREEESLDRKRSLLLLGLGVAFKPRTGLEVYGNLSQNYRAINFTDLRIDNPNGRVDPDIQDERGFTADLGFRYRKEGFIYLDVTAFYLFYRDRIGLLLRADEPPLFNDYRLRTNIADARILGLEAFAEVNVLKWIAPRDSSSRLSIFLNTAIVDARYINTEDNSIRDKRVELAPPFMVRTGISWIYRRFRLSANWAFTSEHFTDATNARRTASAVNGIIPSYRVADVSAAYRWKWFTLELSCNNLFNTAYFTRRADSYPGPGIIPADGRSVFGTIEFRW